MAALQSEEVELAAVARRSALYWLLSDIVLTCPNALFVARIRKELTAQNRGSNFLAIALSEAANWLPSADDVAGIQGLAVEHTRLFGGLRNGHGLSPPLESSQFETSAALDVAETVVGCYADAGLDPSDAGVPPDHLGAELRFVALLCYQQLQAWHAGRSSEAKQKLECERRFIDDHLARWAPQRWRLIADCSKHQFYRCVANIAAVYTDSAET